MKNRFIAFFIILVLFSCYSKPVYAQESTHRSWPRFAIVGQYPLMLNSEDKIGGQNLLNVNSYQLGIETTWQSGKNANIHYAFDLLYATYFYRYATEIYYSNESTVELTASTFFGSGNHFFEIGLGTDFFGMSKVIFGYRTYLWKKLLLKVQFLPTSFFLVGYEDSNYWDFGFGVGYQINRFNSQKVSEAVMFFIHRSSIELEAYLVPFEKDERSPVPPLMFNFGFVPYRNGNFDFIVNGGLGVLSGGDFFYQAGLANLYGKDKHFVEAGINFIFALLRNPNYYYQYSQYVLPQLRIGYRYRFYKNRLFARIAYAPYIRVLDWKREGGLHQNAVLGIGYRFGR